MQPASSNVTKARNVRLPIDGPPPTRAASLTAVGRNVVSTGGTEGPADEPDRRDVCGLEKWRAAASCNRLESSSSAGATLTGSGATLMASGATTTMSCGSSGSFGVSVECMNAPYSGLSHPYQGRRQSTTPCPLLQLIRVFIRV